jgi:hypothetical protein
MTPWATSGVRVSPVEHHVGWAVDVLESLRELPVDLIFDLFPGQTDEALA